MLRRFTGVEISDFGCAFNAYRRSAVEPMLGSIGRQKFTKALVLSGGATVTEVDVAHAPRARRSRYSPLRLTRLALHVLAGFWPQPIQWIGVALGVALHARSRRRSASYAVCLLDRPRRLPRAAPRRRRRALRARDPGLHPRPGRGVLGQNPARGRGQAALHDRQGALVAAKRVLVTGGAGFISSNLIRHLLANTPYEVVSLDALTYAGNLENLADVMSHERLSFVTATSATPTSCATSSPRST